MSSPLQILVVDDNRTAADALADVLRIDGHQVLVRYDGAAAIELLDAGQVIDLVLTDLRMEPIDGLAVVRAAQRRVPPVEVLVFTAFGTVEVAVEAMRLGARDFLSKPVTVEQLRERVRQVRSTDHTTTQIAGDSAHTRALREHAAGLARVRSCVLITGETGVGRSHLAHWLHENGPDAHLAAVVLRPHALPAEEHLKSAGTLILPNIDDWPRAAQAEIVAKLEGLEVGQAPRIIATASPSVEVRAARGEVIPELYFRLAVLVVQVAPLRDRAGDIESCARLFIEKHARTYGRAPVELSPAHMNNLLRHGWPGNLRELSNLCERAVVMGANAFDFLARPAGAPSAVPSLAEGFMLNEHLESIEKQLLERAIEETGGDRPAMGRLLGLERNTLRYKLNKYNLLDKG